MKLVLKNQGDVALASYHRADLHGPVEIPATTGPEGGCFMPWSALGEAIPPLFASDSARSSLGLLRVVISGATRRCEVGEILVLSVARVCGDGNYCPS